MKSGHGFGDHSQDGELARWGLGRDTKWRSCYAQKRLRNAKPGNHLKDEPSVDGNLKERGIIIHAALVFVTRIYISKAINVYDLLEK